MEAFLEGDLPTDELLVRGSLPNGFQYVLQPNFFPKDRLEAYLEVKTGSIHEEEPEQGMAHMLEHCVFLGTDKFPTSEILRKTLAEFGMSFGADSNAFTDFRQTVYTLNAPVPTNQQATPQPRDKPYQAPSVDGQTPVAPQEEKTNLYRVLDILHELCFKSKLGTDAEIDLERNAVLSELQLRNTIEYRMECAMYQQIHAENALCRRFPIGREDCIKAWTRTDLEKFYRTWYTPNNMCLFVVGNFDVATAQRLIHHVFGQESPYPTAESTNTFTRDAHLLKHDWGKRPEKMFAVFQHDLVTQFTFALNCKLPPMPLRKGKDLLLQFLDSVIAIALDNRVEKLFKSQSDPPFTLISWDYTDSFRDACGLNSLVISGPVSQWKDAICAGVGEVHRMYEHGLTEKELKKCIRSFLKDSSVEAEQFESNHSEDFVEDLLEWASEGSALFNHKQEYEGYQVLHPLVTLDKVNARAKELFEPFVSFLDHESPASCFVCAPSSMPEPRDEEMWEDASSSEEEREAAVTRRHSSGSLHDGPVATSTVHGHTHSTKKKAKGGKIKAKGLKSWSERMSTGGSSFTGSEEEWDESDEEDEQDPITGRKLRGGMSTLASTVFSASGGDVAPAPQNAKPFLIDQSEICEIIKSALGPKDPPEDLPIPDCLLTPEQIREKMEKVGTPTFVSCSEKILPGLKVDQCLLRDEISGVSMVRLSNGMAVNMKQTQFVPKEVQIKILSRGGRSLELPNESLNLGLCTLVESGVEGFPALTLSEYSNIHGIDLQCHGDSELVCLSAKLSTTDGGLARALEILHMYMRHPAFFPSAFDRAKKDALINLDELQNDIERNTSNFFYKSFFCDNGRYYTRGKDFLKKVKMADVVGIVLCHLCPENMEINVVGDYDEGELMDALLKYMGTLERGAPWAQAACASVQNSAAAAAAAAAATTSSTGKGKKKSQQNAYLDRDARLAMIFGDTAQKDHPLPLPIVDHPITRQITVPDEESRAIVHIGFKAPNRWATTVTAKDRPLSSPPAVTSHSLYVCRSLVLLSEVLNQKLYTEIREHRGLCYSISFAYTPMEVYDQGFSVVTFNCFPERLRETVEATMAVLKEFKEKGVAQEDLDECKPPLVAQAKTSLTDNSYWHNLLGNMQNPDVPKTIECLHGIPEYYQSLGVEDANWALKECFTIENPCICVGVSK